MSKFSQNVGKIKNYRKKGVKNDTMYMKMTRERNERKNFEEISLKVLKKLGFSVNLRFDGGGPPVATPMGKCM